MCAGRLISTRVRAQSVKASAYVFLSFSLCVCLFIHMVGGEGTSAAQSCFAPLRRMFIYFGKRKTIVVKHHLSGADLPSALPAEASHARR